MKLTGPQDSHGYYWQIELITGPDGHPRLRLQQRNMHHSGKVYGETIWKREQQEGPDRD